MAVANSSVINAEIERVDPKVPILYENEDTFYSWMAKKKGHKISERDMRIPLNLRPGGHFGFYDPDGGDLGTGDQPTWDKAVINTVHMKHAIQWTKKSEWGTDSSRKSVVNLFRDLLAKAMPEFRRQCDSQCMTAGSAVLATVSAQVGGGVTSCTLDSDGYGARLVRFGQRVNVLDTTLATNRTASGPVKINYLDLPTKIIKFDQAVTGLAATDVIIPEGLGASPTGLFGVPYHVSASTAGTWLGFTRSATPEVLANQVAAGGGLALSHARRAVNLVGDRLGREHRAGLTAWTHPAQKQAYEALGQLAINIDKQAKEESLDMFFDGMRLAGAPLKEHYSWDRTRIDFLTQKDWGRVELKAAGFYEVDGRRIFEMRGATGGVATSQVFYLCASWNMYTERPAGQSYISGLTVPTGY